MKTARRQELRTNELSHQIDRLSETIKQHGLLIVASVFAAIFIVFGGYWYFNRQANLEDAGWSRLIPTATDENVESVIARFQAVAGEEINPALTRAAWLSVGDRILSELYGPKPTSPAENVGPEPNHEKLSQTAHMAFTKVIEEDADDLTARGRALLGLGILDENLGEIDKARGWYQRVIQDPRFDKSPFKIEATYRLAGLDQWSNPIEFPPPPPIELVSSEPSNLEVKPVDGPSFANLPPVLAERPPSATPVPTTQPADDNASGADARPGVEIAPVPPVEAIGPTKDEPGAPTPDGTLPE
ncbi:MAG: tol-pal system YbgF family protein [Phycisphaerae bacterium]